MDNDAIFNWIIKHPQNYSGLHLESQPRTFEGVKPLEPKAQFHLIIKALGEYVRENMEAGRGINFRKFGAFTFDIVTDLIKPAQLSNFDITKDLDSQREQRQHNHKIRPCFVADPALQNVLARSSGKQQLDKPKSQSSIYQKGFSMIYCNPVPIAVSCYLDKLVAQSALQAFSRAVCDLVEIGRNLEITIGVVKIRIVNQNLTYHYDQNFANLLNRTQFQKKMKKSITQTKKHWEEPYEKKWQTSNLSKLIEKPQLIKVNEANEKCLTLKIMSLDLNTTQKISKNQYK